MILHTSKRCCSFKSLKRTAPSVFSTSRRSEIHDILDEETSTKTVLDNGLTIIAQQIPYVKSLSAGVWILTGSRYENQENMGICHFIEHAVFKGTKHRNARQIAKSLEDVGGSLNAFTSKEHTCYYATILSEHMPLAMNILSDLVIHAAFNEEDIRREKQIVLEEIKDTEDTPEEFVQDVFYQQIFKDHPLGYSILGTPASIQSYSRKAISEFYKKYYVPSNIIISVAGNFKEKELIREVEKHFVFPGNLNNRIYWPDGFQKYSFHNVQGKRKHIRRNISQAHICVGMPLNISYTNKKRLDMIALNIILGGGMSSRLFQKIREKYGLAYSIYTFTDFLQDTGVFGAYLATDKNNHDRAIEVIIKEFLNLHNHPIRNHELKMAQSQMKANLLMGLESTSTRMIRMAKSEIYFKKTLKNAELINYINSITIDKLDELINVFIKKINKQHIVIIN